MTDQELIAYLKLQGLDKDIAAADRIEELVKDKREAALSELVALDQAAEAYDAQKIALAKLAECKARLGKAVEALTTLRDLTCQEIEDDDGNSGCGQCEDECAGCIAHTVLAELEGK